MIGKRRREGGDDRVLRFRFGSRDDVTVLLGKGREALEVVRRIADDCSSIARSADRDCQGRIAHPLLL